MTTFHFQLVLSVKVNVLNASQYCFCHHRCSIFLIFKHTFQLLITAQPSTALIMYAVVQE